MLMDDNTATPMITDQEATSIANNYELRELVKIGAFLAEMLSSKVPIAQKLKSRKLWVVFAGIAYGVISTLFSADTTVKVANTFLEAICVAMYVYGETGVDKARAAQNTATVNLLDTMTTAVTMTADVEDETESDTEG